MSSTAAEALQIVWGATLMRYVSGVGVVLVLYDWSLTLNDEVCVHVLEHMPLHSPYALFPDDPCLARNPFLAKGPILH